MPAVQIGSAMRQARLSVRKTQDEVAAVMDSVQPKVSAWETGKHQPLLDDIRAYEEALGLPRGHILSLAGYAAEAPALETAIEADDELSEAQRRSLAEMLRAYRQANVLPSVGAKARAR